ncbi:5947_t:CDS:2 [Diversispora eburnea]|uniref:5947_t:CDS:1 n=1 Tax=Diversispora eburnea TaxID=1213867 RepID=A0A9N9G4T1_9GLOM|nr:5947_t:CDS:2 [Diversispora eburnea]
MSARGFWSSAIVKFMKEDKLKIYYWRVTSPTCNFTELKERDKYTQEEKDQVINFEWIAGEYRVKIVDTVSKMSRDFEKYRQLYKRQRPQLYKSPMEGINMGTSYSDAELVETHCTYEILNDEEAGEIKISDNENEEMNEKKKSKAQTTNNKKEEKEMEKTINYIYEIVKTLKNYVLNIDQNNNSVIIDKNINQNDLKTLNIRGITNITKQIVWLKFCKDKDLDIIGLTETWAIDENCKYIFKNDTIKEIQKKDKNANEYKYFWANGQQTNSGCKPKEAKTHVTKWIIQDLNNYIVKDRHYAIVMGDFNATFNPKIYRFKININARNRSDKPESQILRFLNNNRFKDTFKTYKDITENEIMQNKTTLNFSWRNYIQEVKSRIDQIWVSDNLADQLFCADIIPSDLEGHSDHACSIAEMEDNILKYTKSITNLDKILNKM